MWGYPVLLFWRSWWRPITWPTPLRCRPCLNVGNKKVETLRKMEWWFSYPKIRYLMLDLFVSDGQNMLITVLFVYVNIPDEFLNLKPGFFESRSAVRFFKDMILELKFIFSHSFFFNILMISSRSCFAILASPNKSLFCPTAVFRSSPEATPRPWWIGSWPPLWA